MSMTGQGVMNYSNGDSYEGGLRDGQPGRPRRVPVCQRKPVRGRVPRRLSHWRGHVSSGQTAIGTRASFCTTRSTAPARTTPRTGIDLKAAWTNGTLTHGKAFFGNANVSYEGTFKNNVIDGNGKMMFPNGNYYEGEFKGNNKSFLYIKKTCKRMVSHLVRWNT